MNTLEIVGAVMGIGFLSGIRLYATVLLLGLLIQFGGAPDWMTASEASALTNPWVLSLAGLAALAEFVADKVAWFDSLWDSFHSFIRPIGAAILALEAFGSLDPGFKILMVILCGSMAVASHGSKAASRLLVNHSPEPFTNMVVSFFEDVFIPFGVWMLLNHPRIVLALSLGFLLFFLWVAPKVFRLVRLQLAALHAWVAGSSGVRTNAVDESLVEGLPHDLAGAVRVIAIHASHLPEAQARLIGRPAGLRAGATRSIKGMGNSIGYLAVGSGELMFVTKRGFRQRMHRIPLADIQSVEWKRGILMHRLTFRTQAGERSFFLFKDVDIKPAFAPAPPPLPPPFRVTPTFEPRLAEEVAICCVSGPVAGCSVPVPSEGMVIGRDPRTAHLIVNATDVSSSHARVGRGSGSGIWIEDLQSTNGTFYRIGPGPWLPVHGRMHVARGGRFRLSKEAAEFEVGNA